MALWSLSAAVAHAEADGPDFWEVRDGDAAAFRAEPEINAPTIQLVPGGTKGLQNLGCKGRTTLDRWTKMTPAERAAAADKIWCRVKIRERTGWIQGKFLREQTGK